MSYFQTLSYIFIWFGIEKSQIDIKETILEGYIYLFPIVIFQKEKKKLKQSKDRYFFLRKELVIKLLKHKHCRVVKSNNVADEKKQKNNVADDQ